MGEFLSYSITGGLLMAGMYLAYRVFLARDNQHSFNRAVLLMIYPVAFASPPVCSAIRATAAGEALQSVAMAEMEATAGPHSPAAEGVWGTALIWIYIAGMIIVTARTAVTWARLTAVVRRAEKIRRNGYTLAITGDEGLAPFSWMRYVVVSRSDFESGCRAIAVHELKHIACRHWIDLLVAQAVCVINWFNPVAWLMRDELMLVHEYQADMAVLDSGHDVREYQMLLIRKAVGARFPSLANSLNHSKLKKRITMMYKKKSGAGQKMKVLALVPMLALALGVAGIPAVSGAMSVISASPVTVDKISKNQSADKIAVADGTPIIRLYKVTRLNNDGNQTTVVIRGENVGDNLSVSDATFTNNGKTYHASSQSCDINNSVVGDKKTTITEITLRFPFAEKYKNPRLTLTVNGEKIPFELDGFKATDQSSSKADDQETKMTTTVTVSRNNDYTIGDMAIYVDGKQITEEEMTGLSPEKIASVTVNKQTKSIYITLNKE